MPIIKGSGLVREWTRDVTGLDSTLTVAISFPSQGSNWTGQVIEIHASGGTSNSGSILYGMFLRYFCVTLASINMITDGAQDLSSGCSESITTDGMDLVATLTGPDSWGFATVFVRTLSAVSNGVPTGVAVAT